VTKHFETQPQHSSNPTDKLGQRLSSPWSMEVLVGPQKVESSRGAYIPALTAFSKPQCVNQVARAPPIPDEPIFS
jgi:hypothetical protein